MDKLIKENSIPTSYQALLEQSEIRANLISWYPFQKEQNVLLVSTKVDAMEQFIHKKVMRVQRVEPDHVMQENWDANTFDIIVHIGVIERKGQSTKEAWKLLLECYKNVLKRNGTLLLAVPNRMGLKYFAGCQDENADSYFAGPEGYATEQEKQALSKTEYINALNKAGFYDVENYYPYPDYLFPHFIYSDEKMPCKGELVANIRNFDKDRYILFDEAKVYNSLIQEGVYEIFSNSYLFVAKKITEDTEKEIEEKVIFSKLSRERDVRFQIRTDIVRKANGEKVVRKYPLTSEAKEHVNNILSKREVLQSLVHEEEICFCPVRKIGDSVEFQWMQGISLQTMIQNALEENEEQKVKELIREYVTRISKLFPTKVVDLDLIMSNILIDGNTWNIIDYEWTYEADIPLKYVVYRAMLTLSVELTGYEMTKIDNLLKLVEITKDEAEKFREDEAIFQSYIHGDVLPIQNMVGLLGRHVYRFETEFDKQEKEVKRELNLKEKNTKKILWHIDLAENRDGVAVCSGWAAAKISRKEHILVHITIFDNDGNCITRSIERTKRADVGQMLKTENQDKLWGFQVAWDKIPGKTYTLRLHAGKCQQEIVLEI